MNKKLQLYTLFACLLSIVNSLAIDNELDDINLNNPNLKYSKKYGSSSTSSKVTKGVSKVLKWVIIAVVIILTIIIITCICCCLGCCTCCGLGSSGKKEKYENNNTNVNTSNPYSSGPEVVNVTSENTPQQPQQSYNPAYPPYGAQPPYGVQPSYGSQPAAYPPQGSYPPTGAPYGQPLYPSV